MLKPLSSAISIGTGGPFGAEGPIIMTGGALGSLIAQLLPVSDFERKTLLVAGAAAGMTAVFGTPIAAIMLAVELLLFEWTPRSFIPVVVAAIVADVGRGWLGLPAPLFPFAGEMAVSLGGVFCWVLVGLLAGLLSGVLTRLVYACEDAFMKLPIHWMWWPMIGGLAVGVGGLIDPRALGVGYDNIAQMLSGTMRHGAALKLIVVKAIIWAVALGSGTSGGVLAPLLIIGGAMGAVLTPLFPHAPARVLGLARHGRDDGRHDALPSDSDIFRRRTHRQHARAAATHHRLCYRARGHRAADAAIHPDRESRSPRPPYRARVPR